MVGCCRGGDRTSSSARTSETERLQFFTSRKLLTNISSRVQLRSDSIVMGINCDELRTTLARYLSISSSARFSQLGRGQHNSFRTCAKYTASYKSQRSANSILTPVTCTGPAGGKCHATRSAPQHRSLILKPRPYYTK